MSAPASPDVPPERGARVFFPPPLVFLVGIVAAVGLRRALAPPSIPGGAWRLALGVGLIIGAVGLAASARVWFRRTGQNPVPWKPTPELILRGPYRFTRNPMYLGMALLVIGLGIALDNLWICGTALPALAIVHLIAVLPEERYLTEKFGESYLAFQRKVRRYL